MTAKATVVGKARWFAVVWRSVLAFGFLLILVKYKLDVWHYFPTLDEVKNPAVWRNFAFEKWDVLTLSSLCMLALVMLTRDSGNWQTIGEGCFSTAAMPIEWERVRGRHVFTWIILSNIIIFLTLPAVADWFPAFAALLMLQKFNAIAWIYYLRLNITHYFNNDRYRIPSTDVHKIFIARHREAVRKFMCDEYQVTRHVGVAIACIVAIALDAKFGAAPLHLKALSYVILTVGVVTNEYFNFMERYRRDRILIKIAEDRTEWDRSRE